MLPLVAVKILLHDVCAILVWNRTEKQQYRRISLVQTGNNRDYSHSPEYRGGGGDIRKAITMLGINSGHSAKVEFFLSQT